MENRWFALFLTLLLAGCAGTKPVTVPPPTPGEKAQLLTRIPEQPAAGPVAVVPGPVNPPVPALQAPGAVLPEPAAKELRKPVEWENSDIADWTETRYPLAGDSIEVHLDADRTLEGVVLQSASKKAEKTTTVLFVLDTNYDQEPDKVAKVMIEDQGDSVEIKTAVGAYKE